VLSEVQKNDLFARLVGIICRRIEKSVSLAVRLSEYRAMNMKYVLSEYFAYPYPMLGRSCMGKVGEWATEHNVPDSEILYFFENGAKHKGQLEWIAQRDELQIPVFFDRTKGVPLQAADLLAWCHNLQLTAGGKIPTRYDRGLDRLSNTSNDWELTHLDDVDRIPTILGIPVRDPALKYKSEIIRKDGKLYALIHCWPKNQKRPKLRKNLLTLPDKPVLTIQDAIEAAERYERERRESG
jgi:hypothetical protein